MTTQKDRAWAEIGGGLHAHVHERSVVPERVEHEIPISASVREMVNGTWALELQDRDGTVHCWTLTPRQRVDLVRRFSC